MRSGADSGGRGVRHTEGVVLAGYCLVCGVVASVAGAAGSLLADGTRDKLIVWAIVAMSVALAGGVWWGYSPEAVRRVVALNVSRVHPREGPAGNGRARHRPR